MQVYTILFYITGHPSKSQIHSMSYMERDKNYAKQMLCLLTLMSNTL